MGELVFLCPKTAREIETGITTDPGSLSGARRKVIYLECPHCNVMHTFEIAQGWVDNYSRSLPRVSEVI
jgi:hypothetical protein